MRPYNCLALLKEENELKIELNWPKKDIQLTIFNGNTVI